MEGQSKVGESGEIRVAKHRTIGVDTSRFWGENADWNFENHKQMCLAHVIKLTEPDSMVQFVFVSAAAAWNYWRQKIRIWSMVVWNRIFQKLSVRDSDNTILVEIVWGKSGLGLKSQKISK